MFRLWAKEFKSNRMLRDTTICDDSAETRTHKAVSYTHLDVYKRQRSCGADRNFWYHGGKRCYP